MSDMIERVGARLMRGEVGIRLTNHFSDEEIRTLARAAIEAMREPGYGQLHAAMQSARLAAPPALPACKELWAAELVYTAMIDAALSQVDTPQQGEGK